MKKSCNIILPSIVIHLSKKKLFEWYHYPRKQRGEGDYTLGLWPNYPPKNFCCFLLDCQRSTTWVRLRWLLRDYDFVRFSPWVSFPIIFHFVVRRHVTLLIDKNLFFLILETIKLDRLVSKKKTFDNALTSVTKTIRCCLVFSVQMLKKKLFLLLIFLKKTRLSLRNFCNSGDNTSQMQGRPLYYVSTLLLEEVGSKKTRFYLPEKQIKL